jgi:hypothetical protein
MTDRPREYGDEFFWTICAERYEAELAQCLDGKGRRDEDAIRKNIEKCRGKARQLENYPRQANNATWPY